MREKSTGLNGRRLDNDSLWYRALSSRYGISNGALSDGGSDKSLWDCVGECGVEESASRLFFEYPVFAGVWYRIYRVSVIWFASIWCIWKARNDKVCQKQGVVAFVKEVPDTYCVSWRFRFEKFMGVIKLLYFLEFSGVPVPALLLLSFWFSAIAFLAAHLLVSSGSISKILARLIPVRVFPLALFSNFRSSFGGLERDPKAMQGALRPGEFDSNDF
ncbi:hypothetical protein TSUD_156200 [Trifolium subterraneum]|uniref:Uncharacterized protein n=1 Tax=Trifolium subterraneum TaxID=3900 RepID=A0A2Z6M169_TRISU|nr:hypothetical protein TSUD_156200 [Trifolium subterraneum]